MWCLAVTTLEKLQRVPPRFWINVLLALAAGAILVMLVKHAAQMNRLVLSLILFLFVSVVGFQWIYERNEPAFLTPYVQKIAPYFPSKIDYHGRQQKPPLTP